MAKSSKTGSKASSQAGKKPAGKKAAAIPATAAAANGATSTVAPGKSPVKDKPTATVVFRVSTPAGHPQPHLVGSTPELGMWNTAAAHAMAPAGGNTYAVELELAPDQVVEFKFVWYDGGKNLHWEVGENRQWPVVSGHQTAEGVGLRLG